MKRQSQFACRALVALFLATPFAAQSADTTYAMPYVSMGYDITDDTTGTFLTYESQLAFPGYTLEDVLQHDFFGRVAGGNISSYKAGYEGGLQIGRYVEAWTNANNQLEKVLFSVNGRKTSTYTKVVTVLLTNGVDGVYAVVPASGACNGQVAEGTKFAEFNADGSVKYLQTSDKDLATSDSASGYGCRGLTMTRYIPSDKPVLAFKGITVNNIRYGSFSGYSTGRSFANGYTSVVMAGYNATVTEETAGVATKLRVEMQVIDGVYNKCVIVEFTNGEEGVCARVLAARYLKNGSLGYAFVNNDGSYNGTNQSVARDFSANGYGVFAIKVSVPPSVWTNAAGDGDPTNAANWEGGRVPDEETQVQMGGAVYLTTTSEKSFVCKAIEFTDNVTLTGDCDWTYLPDVTITANGKTIDVGGHNLTLNRVFTGAVTDTTSGTSGTLTMTVAENETLENTGLAITGNLKLVKQGAGTFVASKKSQSYSGGTVVNAGTIKSSANESGYYYGASGSIVTIHENGALDINGKYDWNVHDIVLDGGTIRNSGANQTTYTNGGIGNVTLTADSRVELNSHILFHKSAGATLDLGGHTLTVSGAALFSFSNGSHAYAIRNGTLVISEGTRFNTRVAAVDLTDASIVIEAGAGDWLHNNAEFTVKNLTMENSTGSNKKVYVTGTFKSVTGNFKYICLTNGATIDLAENAGVLETAGKNLTFEANAAITVDIHNRALAKGTQLVAWDAIPAGVTFQWDAITAAGSPETLTLTDEGIFYGVSNVADAYWTNAAGDGDVDNWQNWACTNSSGAAVSKGLPSSLSTIHLPYYVNFSVPAGKSIACAKIQLKSTAILSADCDWRGLGVVTVAGSVLHLQGRTLATAGLATVDDAELKIVNAADTFSQLVFDIPSGQTYENDHLAILQNIQVVKQGAGTFVAKKSDQTYTGGTVVAEGTVKTGIKGTDGPFGEGTVANPMPITVESGATFDLNGQISHTVYRFILNGGILTNTGSDITKTTGFGSLTLEADSTLAATRSVSGWCGHTIDLGGHTLNVTIGSGKRLYLSGDASGEPVTYKAGKVVVSSGGWLDFYKGKVNARNVDFDVNAALAVEVETDVHDYTSRYTENYNNGTSALNVFGTFKPVSSYWYGCTMQGGSTIDLSERTGAWPLTSSFSGGEKTVKFADDALVWVNLGTRTDLKKGDKIIAWTTKPNASIKVIPDTMGAVMKDDGLYLGIEEGVPVADASGKGTVTIPTEWVAAHATGETPEEQYASLTAPRETGNKITLRDNYVLGLEPEVETSVPVLLPAQAGDEGVVILRVGGLDVHPESGAVVKYQMMEKDGTQAEFVAGTVQAEDVFEAGLPASGVKYYKVNVIVTTPEAGEEETVAQVLVNGKAYTSLAAAVADAEEGDTLVVMDDLNTAGTINVPKSMTLDLNELAVEGKLNVKSGATLTVVGVGEFDGPITVEDGGTLDWKNGTHKE